MKTIEAEQGEEEEGGAHRNGQEGAARGACGDPARPFPRCSSHS